MELESVTGQGLALFQSSLFCLDANIGGPRVNNNTDTDDGL